MDDLTIRDTNEAGVLNKSDDLIAAEEKLAAIGKLEELAGVNKLNQAKKMWDEFEFKDLFERPPKKMPCFIAGTVIKTEHGYRNIESLIKGDLVWSFNIKLGQNELQPILQTFESIADKYVKITTTQGQIIEATGGHRFYMPLTKKWKEASALSLGDYFYNPFIEENIQIQTIERIEKEVKTYNIEVAQNHNYIVSPLDILTHNKGKYLRYDSLAEYFFEFYTLNHRISKIPQYAGITIQGLTKRHDQHFKEGEKALLGIKSYNQWKFGTEISSVVLKDAAGNVVFASRVGGVKTSFYEARVIEQYIITYYGGAYKHKGLGKLLNRSHSMSAYAFKNHKGKFNPCRFFV